VRLEEGQYLFTNGGITADVQVALGEPAFEKIRLVIFGEDHAHHNLGGQRVVRSVEGHGSNRVAAKTRTEFVAQPRLGVWPLSGKPFPFLHQ
jgi:hypothetical protein